MGKMRKKELFICSIAEIKMLESRFSRMAANGWLIDKANLFSYEYKKTEPQELEFYVDILPQITAFDYPHNKDVKEYRDMCKESGWTFATSSKQFQIFFTEKKNHMPLPIHTDEKIEAQIMLNTCRKYELLPLLISLFYFLYMWVGLINKGFTLFLLNTAIAQATMLAVFTPPLLWCIGFILVWHFRTMYCIKKDLPLPTVNYKLAKFRNHYLGITAIIALSIMFIGIVMDIFGGAPSIIFVFVLIPLLAFFIGLFIRKQIDTHRRTKKANIIILVGGIIVSVALTIASTNFIISSLGAGLSDRQNIPKDRMALKLEDFGIDQQPEVYNYFSTDTIAFPQNYTYYEMTPENSVRTDVKKSISKYLAQRIFKRLLNDFNDKEWRMVTEMTTDELSTWGALDGYYLNPLKTEVLLLYDKTVLQADYDIEMMIVSNVQKKIMSIGSQ